ncbi:unnamed protein product [Peronospora destructor]|uniref:Uncharacterized protein n=1 Tax=Peronospora destructor TaxID=86335 RepID=A0AAV0UUU3_9STRA|nr:unnamed protein product [Peronospora destructor]
MASETSSVAKIKSVAMTSSTCGSPSPSVKTVTPLQKKAMKKKIKAAVAAVAATQAEEEDMYNICVDHPYLSVLYKRIRSHRKKLEKIKGLAQAQATEGKVLNAQQLELMNNKAPLEKLAVELEMLREQFVVVYGQELEQKQQQQKTVVEPDTEDIGLTKEKEESQESVEQEERAQEVEKEVQVAKDTVEKAEDYANVYELLKTLHVVNLHQCLGKEVPMVLDFFSKILLGNTRPPAEVSYEENLIESLEEAKKYLMKSDKVFACDMTYNSLRALVDELANNSSKKPEKAMAGLVHEAKNSVTVNEETLDIPVVPAEINMMPQISFFAESQLESEKDETASEVKVAELQAEKTKVAAAETQDNPVHEVSEKNEVRIEEQAQVQFKAPPAVESVTAPPLSFAAITAGVSNEGTSSPSASSGSSGNEKKELGPEGNSPHGKNTRRRGQGRWREKGSNSNSGGNKSGNGSPTKPRRSRAPRATDESRGMQGHKPSGSKEDGRSRVERGSRKQNNSSQQHNTAPMIAPHA